MISLNSTVTLEHQHFVEAPEGEVLYMMNTQTGSYLYLNAVAAVIWQQLKTPVRVSSICQHLMTEFEVEAAQCETDVLTFLGQLEKIGSLSLQ